MLVLLIPCVNVQVYGCVPYLAPSKLIVKPLPARTRYIQVVPDYMVVPAAERHRVAVVGPACPRKSDVPIYMNGVGSSSSYHFQLSFVL